MKTALRLLIFCALIIAPMTVPPGRIQALAQPQPHGCCKERDALSSTNWRQNGLSLQNCMKLNEKKDGDNVYQQTGFVWWDQRCS